MQASASFRRVLFMAALLSAVTAPALPAATPDYTDQAQLAQLVADEGETYVLVDVRTAGEFDAGHIPTAINIPWDRIAAEPPTQDTEALVIVYCASGTRSARAAAALKKLGYTRVVDFGAVSRRTGELVVTPKPE